MVIRKLESLMAMGGHPHRTKQTDERHPLGTVEEGLVQMRKGGD